MSNPDDDVALAAAEKSVIGHLGNVAVHMREAVAIARRRGDEIAEHERCRRDMTARTLQLEAENRKLRAMSDDAVFVFPCLRHSFRYGSERRVQSGTGANFHIEYVIVCERCGAVVIRQTENKNA